MSNAKKIGLTGGIGAGKTTIAKVFAALGVPVYNADERALWLTNNDSNIKEAIINLLGSKAFCNHQYNRPYVAQQVFNNKQLLNALNAIIHPAVAADFDAWYACQSFKYVIKEAAIMIESGSYLQLDSLVVVSAAIDTRIQRVMARNNLSKEVVLERINAQMSDKERLRFANFTLVNDNNSLVLPQVLSLHRLFMGL